MKGNRGKIGTPTSVFPVTSKERRQIFSEQAKQEDSINDILYWGVDSFKRVYHSKYGKIPCPANVLAQLQKWYEEQGVITPRR